jgi:hypothetical protein
MVDRIPDPPGGSGGSAAIAPFQITDASTGGVTPAANIQVAFGLLQQPQAGTYIDVTLGGVSLSLAPTLNFSAAGTYLVYLDVNLSGTPSAIVANTTGSVPVDDPTTLETFLLLGIVTVAVAGAGLKVSSIQQAVTGAIVLMFCYASNIFSWSSL